MNLCGINFMYYIFDMCTIPTWTKAHYHSEIIPHPVKCHKIYKFYGILIKTFLDIDRVLGIAFWELPCSSILGIKRFSRVFFKVQDEKEKLENVQKQVKTVQTEIAQVCPLKFMTTVTCFND